ncbi:MAG: hypothetical protein WDM90_08495 [Ferruginibacter sp.]
MQMQQKAAVSANQFVKSITNIDTKNLSAAELKSFVAVQKKLQQAAGNIAATKISISKEIFLPASHLIFMHWQKKQKYRISRCTNNIAL